MIIEILRHTPLWVFAILAALVVLGVQRLRARDVTVRQLFALPLAMSLFSAFGLYQSFGPSATAAAGWLVAVIAALAIGRALPPLDTVQYSAATRRIHIPGSWVPLALMMTIFFLRYVAAVSVAMHPALRTDLSFVAAIGIAYGLSSGLFAARALRAWNSACRRSGAAASIANVA